MWEDFLKTLRQIIFLFIRSFFTGFAPKLNKIFRKSRLPRLNYRDSPFHFLCCPAGFQDKTFLRGFGVRYGF